MEMKSWNNKGHRLTMRREAIDSGEEEGGTDLMEEKEINDSSETILQWRARRRRVLLSGLFDCRADVASLTD